MLDVLFCFFSLYSFVCVYLLVDYKTPPGMECVSLFLLFPTFIFFMLCVFVRLSPRDHFQYQLLNMKQKNISLKETKIQCQAFVKSISSLYTRLFLLEK